jgi:branched-chain amino acid aminotransferase
METLAKNNLSEANVRIIVTGGSSHDFLSPSGHPRLLVLVSAQSKPPQSWYDQGVNVITVELERRLPGAKSIDYLPAAMAMNQARAKGAVEAIYMDRNRLALEGTTSNLFVFLEDTLVTPDQGVLPGITRKVVLDLAAPVFPVQVRDLYYEELIGAREVFITGTNKGIVPVVAVDEAVIGSGLPGSDTRKLMALLDDYLDGLTN